MSKAPPRHSGKRKWLTTLLLLPLLDISPNLPGRKGHSLSSGNIEYTPPDGQETRRGDGPPQGSSAAFILFVPRAVFLYYWLSHRPQMGRVFADSAWPLIGVIFLPATVLTYVLAWKAGVGVSGLNWGWVILGFLVDLAFYSAVGGREGGSRDLSTGPDASLARDVDHDEENVG